MKEGVTFMTQNFNAVKNLCHRAQENSEMIGLIGRTGLGKTIALEYYAKNNKNTIYVWVRKSMTIREFYINVLNAVGYEIRSRKVLSIFEIMNIIALRINSYSGKKLLIVDEAGKFKPGQLEFIHELRDLTKHSLGIVLSGPNYFHDNLMKWKKSNVVGIPELEGRISSYVWLENPTREEIRSFCRYYGIKKEKIINRSFYSITTFRDLMYQIRIYLGK